MNYEVESGPTPRSQTDRGTFTGILGDIDALFREAGARPPAVQWSPKIEDISHPVVRSFFTKFRLRSLDGVGVSSASIGPETFGGLKGWCMLLDVESEDGPFRYSHYGHRIAEYYGADMTGKTTEAFENHISVFFTALYREVIRRREWVLSEHEPPSHIFVRSWQRLIVPLLDDKGQVDRLAVANVAENELRAGLDLLLDPVFVLDEAARVLYANPAAQRYFRLASPDAGRITLPELTGIELSDAPPAEHLLSTGDTFDRLVLARQGSIMERLSMSVSATQHHGRPYFVVMMRLMSP